MVQRASTPRLTYAEYLAREQRSPEKHEYVDGETYGMTGGTTEHARLTAAVIAQLTFALRGRPCTPFSSDLRIRVEATNRAFYPDATVVCGKLERAKDDPNAVTNPTVIVEVLSDSTAAYDLGDKFAHYRKLRSLREVVFLSQTERRIEVYTRGEDDRWLLSEHGPGERAAITSIGASLGVDEVYRDPLGSDA